MKHLVQVKLPSLALELWLVEVCKAIGDSLGIFLEVDERFLMDSSQMVTHIFVELDLRKGLS